MLTRRQAENQVAAWRKRGTSSMWRMDQLSASWCVKMLCGEGYSPLETRSNAHLIIAWLRGIDGWTGRPAGTARTIYHAVGGDRIAEEVTK